MSFGSTRNIWELADYVLVVRHELNIVKGLTNIFLFKLSCEMSFDKCSFTGTSISDQDELQELNQLTLV